MRALFLLGLVVLSGCQMFGPIYYEGTCLTAAGQEIRRIMYPPPTLETSSTTTPPCDDRRQITVKGDKEINAIPVLAR
jgi:hypothetical protein